VSPTLTYYAGGSASGTGSATVPTSAGTYTVVATFPGSSDYTTAQSSPVTFIIGVATPHFGDAGGTYNGGAFPATVAGVSGTAASTLEGVGLVCTYYIGTGTGGSSLGSTAPTSAGTYTVVASFPGSADYAAAHSGPLTFTIKKATPTLSLSDAGGTYNGSAFTAASLVCGVVGGVDKTPAATLERVRPTLTYYVGSTVNGSGSAAAPTSAGTYTVVATFPGSADYAVASSSPLTFTIKKATPTLALSDAGGTYNGSAFAATALVCGVVGGVDAVPAPTLEGVSPSFTYYAGSSASGTGWEALATHLRLG
jgi:hypothetical protein